MTDKEVIQRLSDALSVATGTSVSAEMRRNLNNALGISPFRQLYLGIEGMPKTVHAKQADPSDTIDTLASLSAKLRTRRKAQGMTQLELAQLAGVGRRFVSELENAKDTLEIGKVVKVCQALGVDLVFKARN